MPGYKTTSDRDIKCVLCLLFVKDKKERNWTDKINIYIINCNHDFLSFHKTSLNDFKYAMIMVATCAYILFSFMNKNNNALKCQLQNSCEINHN